MDNSISNSVKIIILKIWIGLGCGLIALILAGCKPVSPDPAPNSAKAPTSTPKPAVSVDELRFQDAETGQRFRALNVCINNIVDNSWKTTSYQLVGNFYTSNWCQGEGTGADCPLAGSTLDKRDQHLIQLFTLFYDQTYPQVFGLGFQTLSVPKTTGWGALYSFAENGGSVLGEGWGVGFHEYTTSAGPADATVDLGWKYRYTIDGPNRTTFDQTSDLSMREDLAKYLSSAQSMRERGMAQIQALSKKVAEAINTHQVKGCDQGPNQGNGIPPACTVRPLTADEETTELDKAKAYFADQEQLLDEHYQEMYTAWMAAFPLDQCWP